MKNLIQKLLKAKEDYYNNGFSDLSDQEFDDLENELRKIDPNNSYFDIVGIGISGKNKIKHKVPMLSMNKAKTIEEIVSWLNKISNKKIQLIIEPKIDGLSCSCVYKNGKLSYLATRGDGKEGQEITYIADYINIPKLINFKSDVEIRGELYIPKDILIFDNKPLRNICVGLVNRKENLEDLKYVKFIAYQTIGLDIDLEGDKIEFLKYLGFDTVYYQLAFSIEQVSSHYNEYKENLRKKLQYETDGLVIIVNDSSLHEEINSKYIVSHHPHYNIALKPPSIGKETILEGIEWQISRYGYLSPIAIIEPIVVGGATIKNASLYNYQRVLEYKLHKGDKVFVVRSNDVIPKLIENFTKHSETSKDLIPNKCPSCETVLEEKGVHLRCSNKNCKEQKIQQIKFWITKCEFNNVSEATIRTLVEHNIINSIRDLYSLQYTDLENLDGFGNIKIKNLINQIKKSKSMTAVQFLSRIGIPNVGEKALKKLGINTIEDFENFNDSTYVNGQNIINFKKENVYFIEDLLCAIDIQMVRMKINRHKVCMTGIGPLPRKDLIFLLEEEGYEFVSSVNKETNILICEDTEGDSSKLIKARKLGIEIVSYEEFFENYE